MKKVDVPFMTVPRFSISRTDGLFGYDDVSLTLYFGFGSEAVSSSGRGLFFLSRTSVGKLLTLSTSQGQES